MMHNEFYRPDAKDAKLEVKKQQFNLTTRGTETQSLKNMSLC
tara:strand:+ start:939 stop:1064 length:126 start_codon:yes stop_codon:yes gene_type:complete